MDLPKKSKQMATFYYHYGLQKNVSSIKEKGLYGGGIYQYTTDVYTSAAAAGTALGISTDNVDCVLKFADDGKFRKGPPVDKSPGRGFVGGGSQYSNSGKPKPIAVRKITESNWTDL